MAFRIDHMQRILDVIGTVHDPQLKSALDADADFMLALSRHAECWEAYSKDLLLRVLQPWSGHFRL